MMQRWSLVLVCSLVAAEASAGFADEPLDIDFNGYWRVRGVVARNVFLGQADFNDVGGVDAASVEGRLRSLANTGYWQHHMRLQPSFSFRKVMSLKMDLDILDNVIWGDNAAVASTPLFAGKPSSTDLDGDEVATVRASRVWLELNIPLGSLRVGRMASNWGMGLLANNGDGMDSDFGDKTSGSTVDRLLFVTKPVSIFKAITGAANTKSNLITGIAFDQLVEDAQEDGEVDPERICATCAPQILVANPNDDVTEIVGIVVYKNDKAKVLTDNDLIQVGTYVVRRQQPSTKASVLITDLHAKLRFDTWGFKTEVLSISGDMGDAIDAGENPKTADIKGGAARLGYYGRDWDFELEGGIAPGDEEPTNQDFTGFPFHADYGVGLLLYPQVLAARTAKEWGTETRGLWSNGGVWNSRFLYPKFRWHPQTGAWEGLTVVGAVLTAVADANNNIVWDDIVEPQGGDMNLGLEFDLSARYDFYGYAHFKVEGAVLLPGPALWNDVEGGRNGITDADKADTAWTVQARLGMDL